MKLFFREKMVDKEIIFIIAFVLSTACFITGWISGIEDDKALEKQQKSITGKHAKGRDY